MTPRLSSDRLWSRLMALAEIGALPKGGVDRQALTDGEIAAWRRVIGWARESGLDASTDAAGNLFLRLAGRDPEAPPILAGSHLDTQPTGGKFDGAFGVMAALEAVTAMTEAGVRPSKDIVVVAWMNEEGCRFAPGMMGSEAFAGVRPLDAIRAVRDADGIDVGTALDTLHAAFPDLPHRPLGFPLAAYVEPHIEQGPLLEQQHKIIGAVTGIQGKKTFSVTIEGEAGHAGTVAMAERRDALAAFTRIAVSLHERIGGHDEDVKFTIGRVRVEPNAPSVIPQRVTFSIDLRHPRNDVLDRLGAEIGRLCEAHAQPCRCSVQTLVEAPSNGFDLRLMKLIEDKARTRGYPVMRLLSAAGHDARHMAPLCSSAMIFIPCKNGISHAEEESAEAAHVEAGAAVLLDVLMDLAG